MAVYRWTRPPPLPPPPLYYVLPWAGVLEGIGVQVCRGVGGGGTEAHVQDPPLPLRSASVAVPGPFALVHPWTGPGNGAGDSRGAVCHKGSVIGGAYESPPPPLDPPTHTNLQQWGKANLGAIGARNSFLGL